MYLEHRLRSRWPKAANGHGEARCETRPEGGEGMNNDSQQAAHEVDASGSLVSDKHRRRLSGSQKLIVGGVVLALSLSLIWLGGRQKKVNENASPSTLIATNTKPFHPAPIEVPPDPPAVQEAVQPAAPLPPRANRSGMSHGRKKHRFLHIAAAIKGSANAPFRATRAEDKKASVTTTPCRMAKCPARTICRYV